MENKNILYVKNLPTNVIKAELEQRLKQECNKFGQVFDIAIIVNKQVKKPQAFINFSKIEDNNRQKVIDQLQSQSWDGKRNIIANWKQSQQERMKNTVSSYTLILFNLKSTTTQQDLLDNFSKFGSLISVNVQPNNKYETLQGWLNYDSQQSADNVMNQIQTVNKTLFKDGNVMINQQKKRNDYQRNQSYQMQMQQQMQQQMFPMFYRQMNNPMMMQNRMYPGFGMFGMPQMQMQMPMMNMANMEQMIPTQNKVVQHQVPRYQTLKDIKADLNSFTKLPTQKQIENLSAIASPLVRSITQNNVDKIVSLLIDFDVFQVSEILEFLEDHNSLNERVNEAIELLENN